MYLINIQYNLIIIECEVNMGNCHPLKNRCQPLLRMVHIGFLGVKISHVTLSRVGVCVCYSLIYTTKGRDRFH